MTNAQTCAQLLVNSDMESNVGWGFGNTPAQAEYVTDRYLSPYRSILLGVITGPNKKSYSSMQQLVTVPAGSLLRLRAHVYPISQPYDLHDAQELIIMNSSGQPLRRVWTATSDARAWQTLEFDISEFIGMQIGVYFNVYNDGQGGVTAMYIDDVTLELCTGGTNTPTPTSIPATATPTPTPGVVTATPTPTPIVVTATPTPIVVTNTPTTTPIVVTPTSTPTPIATFTPPPGAVCNEMLLNGGFEAGDGWRFGNTKLRGYYTSRAAHSGLRSAQLGNDGARSNILSYSSISQRVNLPPGYTSATLEFWHWDNTDQEPGDYQELLLLDGRTGRTLDILWRSNAATTQWRYEGFDISRYVGRDIIVYFNVFNNGGTGRASMWVDDVTLKACAPPTPTSPPPTSASPGMGMPWPTVIVITSTAPGMGASPSPTVTSAVRLPSPTAAATRPAAQLAQTPTPPLTSQSGTEGPLGLLWYLLIFAVIAMIFLMGYLIFRQIWSQMAGGKESLEHAPPPAEHEITTPVVLPTERVEVAGETPTEEHAPPPSEPDAAADEPAEASEREEDAIVPEDSESPDESSQ